MQGEVAGDVLAGLERRYEPGIWFNSAKFIELEHQIYGRVNRSVPGERNLIWVHVGERRSLRLVFKPQDGVIGFNLMGMRFRHRVCERWIAERRPIGHALEHLDEAHFDPELSRCHAAGIRAEFRRGQNPE